VEATLETIEVLGDVEFVPDRSVTLTGDGAREVADSLGRVTKVGFDGFKTVKKARRTAYALVPSEKTSARLAAKTLRWATPSHGDASVLIKNKAGQMAGHGELHKVKPKAATLLSPAVWEAMAMATQQHYLVDISEKLAGIDAKVDEVLARLDDDDKAALLVASKLAARTAGAMERGETVSADRVRQLRSAADSADVVWHSLLGRAQRHVAAYRTGKASVEDVELSFALLLEATFALVACADVTAALPHFERLELDAITREEEERVIGAITELRALGDGLCDANSEWAAQWAAYWHERGEKTNLIAIEWQHRRPIKRLRKPRQKLLGTQTVTRCRDLTTDAPQLDAVLVEITEDGRVRVGAAPAQAKTMVASAPLT